MNLNEFNWIIIIRVSFFTWLSRFSNRKKWQKVSKDVLKVSMLVSLILYSIVTKRIEKSLIISRWTVTKFRIEPVCLKRKWRHHSLPSAFLTTRHIFEMETVVLRIIAASHNSVFERESDISARLNGLPQIILHAF